MNNPIPGRQPPNIQAELAKERNRAAAERTLMAWIRTCLSLIGFGLGIDSVVSAIQNLQADINPVRLSRLLGLAFIALGTYAMIAAAIEHHQELRHIQRDRNYLYTPRRSLGLTVALGLIGIGVFAFFGILIQALV